MRWSRSAQANGRTRKRIEFAPSTGMNWPGAQQEECQIQSLCPSKAHCSLIHFPSQREKRLLDLFAAGKFADKFTRKAEEMREEAWTLNTG